MIFNKNIQIDSIETKMASTGNTKYILVSGKEKYIFWKTHKDGDSDVYLSFTGMNPRKGDTVSIGYMEEEKEFTNREGQSVKYIERNIVSLREAGQGDVPAPIQVIRSTQSPSQGIKLPSSQRPTEPSRDNLIVRQVAFKGAIELAVAGKIELEDIRVTTNRFTSLIENTPYPEITPELPTINQNDEIDVDSIPF